MKTLRTLLVGTVIALSFPAAAFAQPGMGRGGNMPGGNAMGFGGLDAVKGQIRATDEEWKVIGPLLQSVVVCREAATFTLGDGQGNMNMPGMPGGPNGGPPGGFGGGGPGGFPGGDSFAEPGGFGGGGPGGGGRGGRGGRGSFGPGAGPDGANAPFAPGGPDGGADFNSPRGGGRGGGFPGMGANNAVALALNELGAALSTTNAPMAEIQEKAAAVREARKKAASDLDAAQTKLRRLLTLQQEAVLLGLGYLD